MRPSLFARLSVWIMFLQFSAGNLDEFLNYYETLHHDNLRHQIRRRDLYTKNPIERIVEFESHGKHFKLMLHRNTSVLSSNFKVSVYDTREKRSTEIIDTTIYKGYMADEPSTSSVSAYWDDDQHFTARISTESDIFVVEPSWRHLPDSPDYTLISYKGSDLKQNEKPTNEFCGVASNSAAHGKASDADEMLNDEADLLNKGRTKRNAHSSCPPALKTCEVLLVADFRFHREVGKNDVASTSKYMIYVVDQVDELFRDHKFGNCGDGYGVAIKKILVHKEPSEESGHYNSRRRWTNSSLLLKSFSRGGDYSDYCLVHLFTAIPFSSGVLGIANVASPDTYTVGGLCSGLSGFKISKNTGWTTFLGRNGKRVLAMQAFLVVAHEFGHGWGSHHDPENSSRECSPSHSQGGNFLMHVHSVTGRQPNNRLFSSCSISTIHDALVDKTKICFTAEGNLRSLCGNYNKDNGEECDEGPGSDQTCCGSTCHLLRGAECSDFHDACCEKCKIANASKICKEESVENCKEQAYCNGNSSSCPEPTAKPDGEECERQGVCSNKMCISVCEYNNKIQCFCDSVDLSCRICCRDSLSDNDTCQPYRLSNGTTDFGNVSDNTPCPLGLCSEGVCVKVSDVTIQRTWKFIKFESVAQFVKFMKDNIVGTVIILSLFFWIPASCAVSHIDRKRANQDLEGVNWLHITNNLLIPELEHDGAKIKRAVGTLERTTCSRKAGQYEKGKQYKQ